MGCMVEMEPTRAKFKIWGQHGIPELAGVNLGRGSNSGLNIHMQILTKRPKLMERVKKSFILKLLDLENLT